MLHRLNKTRAAKEGVIEPSAADLIRPFVAGPDTPPRYSLHFGTINKVGVNPKSEYSTPLAVCAFPLTPRIFKQFLDVRLPFAQDTRVSSTAPSGSSIWALGRSILTLI